VQVTLPFVLAATLAYLAVPRTLAALASLEAAAAFEALWAGKAASDIDLAKGLGALGSAVSFAPSSERLIRLAELELAQSAQARIAPSARSESLATAERHFIAALSIDPIQSFGWLGLAHVRIARGAEGREIVGPLLQSIYTAPNLRLIWVPRTALLLRYWKFMTSEELPDFSSQIRTIWLASAADRAKLIETAIAADEMEVVAAMAGEPPASMDQLRDIQRRSARRTGRK
jgi:hypothetical protein